MLELRLPQFHYKLTKKDNKLFIFDEIRKKFLQLTPEEWVRQHFVNYLVNHKNITASLISLEGGKKYNSLQKRCDILVYNKNAEAWLLAECKAPHIPITESTFFQLCTYNSVVKAPVLVLTNGIQTIVYEKINNNYQVVEDIPLF